MKTLFLHPPSYDGFDGGAGARYQAKREIRSVWYPTWLAQPAALIPDSKLIDAQADGLSLQDIVPLARQYDARQIHHNPARALLSDMDQLPLIHGVETFYRRFRFLRAHEA